MGRVVWLRRGADRGGHANEGTIGLWSPSLAGGPPPGTRAVAAPATFEEAFRRHYSAVRDVVNCCGEAGLGMVVVGPDEVEGTCWFEARPDEANPLILGRHSAAEVFCPGDPTLSLRHLALAILPKPGEEPVRFRIFDLRTASGFKDERGRTLEAVESQGPLMIRSASLMVMLFPTAKGQPEWPQDAAEAWARVPDRVYFDARSAGSARIGAPVEWRSRSEAELVDPGAVTLVPSFPGPVFASRDMAGAEPPRGELLIGSPMGSAVLRLGAQAAEQGVLLGRYERCDTAGLPGFSNGAVSRVHLLVIDLDGTLYAIDTASRNGTWQGELRVRSAKLQPGVALSLAREVTVEWRPFH